MLINCYYVNGNENAGGIEEKVFWYSYLKAR